MTATWTRSRFTVDPCRLNEHHPWLGTDDNFGGTSLFGEDLHPDVLDRLQRLRVVSRHPFAFFEKTAFLGVGVIPDASGIGKHDILLAKRVPSRRKEG